MIQLAATTITPAAQLWLAGTTHARPLNIFAHACNLVNQNGAVLALATAALPLAPFALQIEVADFHGLKAADGVQVAGSELNLGPWRIRTANAKLWNPRPDWIAVRRTMKANPRRLASLAQHVLADRPPSSLLELYCAPGSNSVIKQAALGAANLVNGVRTHTLDQAIDGAHQLAGLGQGLTPSGDDFIIGVMFAAWAGLYGATAAELCVPLAQAAAPRTTTLSAAFLHAAARGEAMSPWHALLAALARLDDLPAALRAVLNIGHTSGADALAGFLASYNWKVFDISCQLEAINH